MKKSIILKIPKINSLSNATLPPPTFLHPTMMKLIFCLALSFLLYGCGGGGSGSTPAEGSGTNPNIPPISLPIKEGAITSTFAGGGEQAVNGQAEKATFYHPMGLATDENGNIYVADTGNNQIRKITPNGDVTVIAGNRKAGANDGKGMEAAFNQPFSVAVDAQGNIFVADTGNHSIRKISKSGLVEIIAGNGFSSSIDGIGRAAGFSQPEGIAVDKSGNIFVSETGSNQIRKVTATGVVSTVAGSFKTRGSSDGIGSTATFNNPKGLAVDTAGNVFVADTNNGSIRKINQSGVVTTIMKNAPEIANIAVSEDGNTIYFSDLRGRIKRTFLPNLLSDNLSGPPEMRALPDVNSAWQTAQKAFGIALAPSGYLYISDTWRNQIKSIKLPERSVHLVAGSPSYGNTNSTGILARFNLPMGLTTDSEGNIYVVDSGNCIIKKISLDKQTTTFAGSATCGYADGVRGKAEFRKLAGIGIDSSNNIYVTDDHRVRKISPLGVVSTVSGGAQRGSSDGFGTAASFYSPQGIAIDSGGTIFVADTENHLIRKITPDGIVKTIAGSLKFESLDGRGVEARFNLPSGIAIDSQGYLIVSDFGSGLIRKISSSGDVTTFAGGDISDTSISKDGVGRSAKFASPLGLTVDRFDNIYVADSYSNSIRRISSKAEVSTISGGELGNIEGQGKEARFFNPSAVAIGRDGVVFVSDTWNDQIKALSQ